MISSIVTLLHGIRNIKYSLRNRNKRKKKKLEESKRKATQFQNKNCLQ